MPLRPFAQRYQGPNAVTRAAREAGPPVGTGAGAGAAAERRAGLFAPLPREITATIDLEDHGAGAARIESVTLRLLDALDAVGGARATVFVLGETAAAAPGLVRETARRGHEIACHGQRHRALGRESPGGLRAGLAGARARLEDLAGAPVLGFRAPMFSLTRRAVWATEVLGEVGFAYSSSVLPAWNPLHGFPGAPEEPFLWPAGVLEIPVPLGRIGPFRLPFLGGGYLRWLPPFRLRRFARQLAARPGIPVWTYCHPYDLDEGEAGVSRVHDSGRLASLLLRLNRGLTAPRLEAILRGRVSRPFAARLAAIRAGARVFAPEA